MKTIISTLIALMLLTGMVSAATTSAQPDTPLVAWIKSIFKPKPTLTSTKADVSINVPATTTNRPADLTVSNAVKTKPTTSSVQATTDTAVKVWGTAQVSNSRIGVWCAALKGVFIEFYNAPYYVSTIDVDHDGQVDVTDLALFMQYYRVQYSQKSQEWCKFQFIKPTTNSADIAG